MATFQTYEMKGLKQSFANWISNLSPTGTPFVSMTGKEMVDQVKFSWQVDRLAKAAANAQKEGEVAGTPSHTGTAEMENYTQILRKAVRMSTSAKTTGLYGRSNDLSYQMEKASLEIKRDLEFMLLNNGVGSLADKNSVRRTSGFRALVGVGNTASGAGNIAGSVADVDTGAVVVKQTAEVGIFSEKELFDLTMQLYLSGAKVDTIMVHPKWVSLFSRMFLISPTGGHRARMFDDLDPKFNMTVRSIKDPLGQVMNIIPNRAMPEQGIYFFNSKDWTQMVFRSPEKSQLAKTGSSEKWMIEMEVGLRHRNPYASGILMIRVETDANLKSNTITNWDENQKLTELRDLAFIYGINIADAADAAAIKAKVAAHFPASGGAPSSDPEVTPVVRKTKAKTV